MSPLTTALLGTTTKERVATVCLTLCLATAPVTTACYLTTTNVSEPPDAQVICIPSSPDASLDTFVIEPYRCKGDARAPE